MYKSLQACRAVAAILIVLYHLEATTRQGNYFGAQIPKVFVFGQTGVNFFFVLSGFIIFFVHRRDIGCPGRFGNYLKKRALRIYPIYWIVFLAVLAGALVFPSLRGTVPHDFSMLLKGLLLIPQDRALVGGTGAPILIVAWSLQYEILFYLCFAGFVLNRYLGIFFVALMLGIFFLPGGSAFPISFFHRDWMFLFGFGAITAYLSKPKVSRGFALTCAAIGACSFLLLSIREDVDPIQPMWGMELWYGVASSFIIFGLVKAEDTGAVLGGQPLVQLLGAASYVLYLVHYPVISILCKLAVSIGLKGLSGVLIAYFAIPLLCMGTAVIFHLWVEVPLLRWLSGTSSKSLPAVA